MNAGHPVEFLSADRVDAWLIRPEAVPDRGWPRYVELLDDSERVRARRFVFDRDRKLFIAAHALLRSVLSRYVPRPPAEWRFVLGPHGKPALAATGGDPEISFNLSHTAGLAACAVTAGAPVGVDVELSMRSSLTLDLAKTIFNPAEVACVEALPSEQQAHALSAFWTLKEAVVKAVGFGLSLPLQSFSISLDPPAVTFTDSAFGRSCDWNLALHRPTSRHTLAIAVRGPAQRRLHIVTRAWAPPVV